MKGSNVINEEGIENRWKRHHEAHLRLIKGLESLGLTMLVPEPHRLWNLNTPKCLKVWMIWQSASI